MGTLLLCGVGPKGGNDAGAPSWQETFDVAIAGNSSGWSGLNLRQIINAVHLSVSGSQVRVTLQGGSTQGCSIDSIYIGHQAGAGDAWDFDGGQVQLLVGASGSFSVGVGAQVVTDAAVFAFDHTKAVIIAAHFNAGSAVGQALPGNVNGAFRTAADETSVSNVSGYTNATGSLFLVTKIEVLA